MLYEAQKTTSTQDCDASLCQQRISCRTHCKLDQHVQTVTAEVK